jgi:hypothetical protein
MVHETRTRPTKHKAKKLKESLKELEEGLSFGLLTRQKNDFSVSLAAASCCSSGADPWS